MAQAADCPAARLELVDGVIHLDPKPALFDAMLAGWVRQQQTRFLKRRGNDQATGHASPAPGGVHQRVSLGVDAVGCRGVLQPSPVF